MQSFSDGGVGYLVATGGAYTPVWSRDGRRLFYKDNSRIMVSTVTTAPAFTVVSRTVFRDDAFSGTSPFHATYDVSPDGTQLLITKLAGDPALMVIHDWHTELNAHLAPRAPK